MDDLKFYSLLLSIFDRIFFLFIFLDPVRGETLNLKVLSITLIRFLFICFLLFKVSPLNYCGLIWSTKVLHNGFAAISVCT
jgi:isoprenylcysteine carboxyl methyltransferase (ICMT) family protein YpbQ